MVVSTARLRTKWPHSIFRAAAVLVRPCSFRDCTGKRLFSHALQKIILLHAYIPGAKPMPLILIPIIVIWGAATIYLAYRFRDVRKFLAGAFFVSWGTQVYFYFANVSVPLLGTNFVITPEISAVRSIPHFIFFVLCLYFGFFWKRKAG